MTVRIVYMIVYMIATISCQVVCLHNKDAAILHHAISRVFTHLTRGGFSGSAKICTSKFFLGLPGNSSFKF